MSNISSTYSANQIISNIKKNSDDFSFIDILSYAVTNKEFLDGKIQLNENEKNSYTYIWEVLSAIGQDVGETLYSNVLNYIDNVCNIDVCKISALKSMLKAYGIHYTLFDNLGIFPAKLADMLDLLSVNKRYLKDSNVFNRQFVSQLINEKTGIADKVYSNYEIDKLLYRYFKHTISISDDSNKLPFIGTYVLSNDYSYDNITCSVDVDAGINVCREYVYGPIHKVYYNFEEIGQLPENYNPDDCMKQLSADFTATYKIKKINILVDDSITKTSKNKSLSDKQFYYGLFECNKTITYYWKDYSNQSIDETIQSNSDEMIGIMFDFENIVNSNSYERVSFGSIFNNMQQANLSAKFASQLLQAGIDDTTIVTDIAIDKTQKISNIACYERINALDKISTIEFSFNFENGHNCEINDVVIEDSSYYGFLSCIYYCHLSNMCNIAYVDDETKTLLNTISADVDNFKELVNPIYTSLNVSAEFFPYQSNYNLTAALDNKEFKQQNSIDLRFDEKKIVNDIEVGADSIDNYEGVKRILLENEIEKRNQILQSCTGSNNMQTEYKKNILQNVFNTTRTNYYRKELVKQYIKFVEQCNYANDSNIFLSKYDIDDDFILVDNKSNKYKPLLSIDENKSIELDYQMLQNVAKFLADLTLYIANIREKLKTQAVRYYMKGTFNLLSFIINEYLIEFSKNNNVLKHIFDDGSQLQEKYIAELSTSNVSKDQILNELADIKSRLSAHMYLNVNVVEYDDLTEYYNLSSDKTDIAANKIFINNRYWENPTIGSIETSAIQKFYIDKLKNNTNLKSDEFDDFLKILYDIGADPSYFDRKTNQFVIDGIHEDENGNIDNQNKIDQSFMYIGTKDGKQPFYNIKNQTHPSYQVHPYLYNFVKSTNSIYSIENAFKNGLVDDLIADNAQKQYNTNIGKYGQVVDIWKNNAYDFSGYRTSYEIGKHTSTIATGKLVECADYDGMFYPPALAEYMAAYHKYTDRLKGIKELTENICKRTGSFYEKYYKHLNLVDGELHTLAVRLYEYADAIARIADEKQDADEVFDIYKYATDKFGNAYGLYKNYTLNRTTIASHLDSNNDLIINFPTTYAIKENTLGQLWIRLKDSPIAFPAFAGKTPIFQKKIIDEFVESHIIWQLENMSNNNNDDMCYFYDMEFDTTKQVLFLNSWPLNYVINSTDKNYTNLSPAAASLDASIFKKKEYSMVIVGYLQQKKDELTNETKLYITHDAIQNIDVFPNIYNKLIQKYKESHAATIYDLSHNGKIELNSFVGFYKTVQSTDAVYVAKKYEVTKNGGNIIIRKAEPIIDITHFKTSMFRYTLNSVDDTFEHGPYSVNLAEFANHKYSDYAIASSTIRFNYSDDDIVFGFLSVRKTPEISATNYIGKNVGKGEMVYPNATNGYALPLAAIEEINSFDSLDKYVTIVDAKIMNDDIIYSDINLFNLNSDASYIPQYPGIVGKNLLYKTTKYGNAQSQKYKSIELLGHSKKLTDIVSKIDPNANAISDIDAIQKIKDSIPGRVYEDYDMSLDDLLYINENPLLNSSNSFEWKIPLSGFSLKDLAGVELFLFNAKNNGKNAYYCGSLENLIVAAEDGEEVIADNYISSDTIADVKLSADVADIYVAGTFNVFDTPVNKSDTNHINNIQKIQIEFVNKDTISRDADIDVLSNTKSQSYIIVRFVKISNEKRSYVNENTVKAILYNKFNLKQYEFYHYFDERGIIKYKGDQKYENAYVDVHDLVFDNYCQTLNEREKQNAEDYSYDTTTGEYVKKEDAPDEGSFDDKYEWKEYIKKIDSQRIYLSSIVLSSYNYLSDVIIFKDKQNISFKYNEENVYNKDNILFYYPGYNKIYPSLNVAMFGVSSDQAIDTAQLFNQTNLYITQLENNETFADKIGNVDIPLEYNETNCLRVYEDFDADLNDNDPNMLSCVHFIMTDASRQYPLVEIDGKTFMSINVKNYAKSLDEAIVNSQAYGYYGILTEQLSSDFEFDKISFTATKANTNLKNLLDIYTNYEVMKDGKIRLFFNYCNYMNSPFIEIVNGKQQIKAIDGTYLKLDPGESGLLDIVVQFKAYYGNNLYGVKTGVLVTYKIFNVSDDKPKFVIYKLSEIAKGTLSDRGVFNTDAMFSMVNQFIDLDDDSIVDTDGKIKLKIKFILESNEFIAAGATFKIDYNLNELSFKDLGNLPGFDCHVEENSTDESYGHITLTTTQIMKLNSVFLDGKTAQFKTNIVKNNITSYDMTISEIHAVSIDGDDISISKANGSVMFGYNVLLRKEEPHEDALVEQERQNKKLPSFIIVREV